MRAVLVEFGDHPIAEQFEAGEDLLVMESLDRETERQLIHSDIAPGRDLLGDVVGAAAQHVTAGDQAVEQRVGVAVLDHVCQ